ncbi:MAG: ADP-ribosylglycohydrolase family protein [Cetobacterium sp.]
MSIHEKFTGVLLGGCVGDVLGSINENKTYDAIRKKGITTTFNRNRYTDDTEMTIILAQYLVVHFKTEHSIVKTVHEMYQKVVSKSKRGYSKKTKEILGNYHHCSVSGEADTNGSVMRISPLALVPISNDSKLRDYIKQVVYCTHGESKNAIDVCFIHVKLLRSLIYGRNVGDKHVHMDSVTKAHEYVLELAKRVRNLEIYPLVKLICQKSLVFSSNGGDMLNSNIVENIFGFDFMQINAIKCYVCVLVCFLYNFDNPRNGLIMAANIGGDTDTIAKLVGDLFGAKDGVKWIPEEWKEPEGHDVLKSLAESLFEKN